MEELLDAFNCFALMRTTDVTGISGTGMIALGVQYPDGQCSLWWSKYKTTGIYPNIATLQDIHCYNNNAYILWGDDHGLEDGRSPISGD